MPIIVERLADEPILIAVYTDHITVEEVLDMYRTSAELIGDDARVFHRISDVRGATTDFAAMLKLVQAANQANAGSSTDSHIQVTYVGTTMWIKFLRDTFAKRGVLMPAFEDLETALESVRYRIKTESETSPST